MIDLHYPGYKAQFDQLKPVSYDGDELVLESDKQSVVNYLLIRDGGWGWVIRWVLFSVRVSVSSLRW